MVARRQRQLQMERWATARVIRKTLFNWKQYVARQETLLKEVALNNKPKQRFFNRNRDQWQRVLRNADVIRMTKRLWRFQTSRDNHGRRQLTIAESFAFSQARAAAEADGAPWID